MPGKITKHLNVARVRELTNRLGWDNKRIAEKALMDQGTVAKALDRKEAISLHKIVSLAEALKILPGEIILQENSAPEPGLRQTASPDNQPKAAPADREPRKIEQLPTDFPAIVTESAGAETSELHGPDDGSSKDLDLAVWKLTLDVHIPLGQQSEFALMKHLVTIVEKEISPTYEVVGC